MKSIYERFVRLALLSSIIVFFNLSVFSATYYLAPTGSDSNSGTITSPWFTLNKAWTVVKAGDIVYLRGGVFAFDSQQYLTGKNGASGSVIQILAYPGESPVLTKSGKYTVNEGIHFSGDYFYWKGIEITGFTQISSGLCDGFRVENSSYNTFEELKIHNNGNGMQIANLGYTLHSTGNLVLNCDFYENQDPMTVDKYGNADGLAIEWITHPEDVNTIRGCRFWWNTDDGLDLYHNEGTVIIENCQSFYNGYIPQTFTTAGDGNGFKLGDGITNQSTVLKRIVKNCISAKNRMNGFTPNALYGIIELDNCTAYGNGNIGIHISDFNLVDIAKNCLSFSNGTNIGLSTAGTYVTNSWQNSLVFSTADFKSLDTNLLLAVRKSDGSLPDNDYLKLIGTSKLIDKGTNVGIPYNGSAPDIGSFEYVAAAVVLPSLYNVTGGGSYCTGGSGVPVGLNGSQSGVNYQLQLNGVNSGNSVPGTGSAISFGNKTLAGTYTVIATNTSTLASSTMTGNAVVTVNALPIVSFTSGVATANAGSTGNVYATQLGMSDYKWTVSSGGTITSGGTSGTNSLSVTWNTTGTQYVTVNYSNTNGCVALQAATYTITVNTPPSGYNVTGGGSYCTGGTGVSVGLSGSESGVTYQLQLNGVNDGTAVLGTGSAITFGNKTSAGTYTVVAKNASTLLTSNMGGSAVVKVNPLPIVSFTSGVSSANVGSTGNVYATQSGMTNYKWTVSSGGTITSGGSSDSNAVTITWNTTGNQMVSVNYSNSNGCAANNATTFAIAVNAVPSNDIIALPSAYSVTGGGSYCNGGAGVLVGLNNSQLGVNYQLSLNGANVGTVIAGSGSSISFGYKTQAGTYTVTGINASNLATTAMIGSAVVSVNPVYVINENVTINQGQTYQGWSTSGQYTRNLTSVFGCDSVVTTNLTVVSVVQAPTVTQTLQLKKGNNLISSYLIPSNIDAGVVIKPLISNGVLYKMYDEDNLAIEYSKTIGSWTNNIGAFDKTDGYLVNVTSACQLQITGTPVTLPLDIPLKAGWNIISYPKTDAVNAMSVIKSLIDQNKLVKVQDETGNSIENLKSYGGWKNNIGNFVSGEAYKVYVSSDAILTIQSSYPKAALNMLATAQTEHFFVSYEGNGLNHMNVNLVGLDSSVGISEGDELAAFDGNICVGAIKLIQNQIETGSVSLISSYNTSDQANDGFVEGNSIQLRVWKKSTESESEILPDVLSGEMKYAQNGSVLVKLKSAEITTGVNNLSDNVKVEVYPNPCNGQFSVYLSQIPPSGSKIDILDISGKLLLTRQFKNATEDFNLTMARTGVYLVRTVVGASQMVHKLVVNK